MIQQSIRYACECVCFAAYVTDGFEHEKELLAVLDHVDGGDYEAAADILQALAKAEYPRMRVIIFNVLDHIYAVQAGSSRTRALGMLSDVVFSTITQCASLYDGYADAHEHISRTLFSRGRSLLMPDAPPAIALRKRTADYIVAYPHLHEQGDWGTGEPECKTAQCAAGWICTLGGGTRGLEVELAGRLLSHVDDWPLVNFDYDAGRFMVLDSLRGTP